MVNLTCRGQVLEPFPGALNFTQFRKRSTTSRVCRQLCQRGLRKVSLSGHLISNSNGSTTAGTSTACRASPVKALGCVMLTHAKGSTSSSLHSSAVYHHAAAWREMRKSGSRGAEEEHARAVRTSSKSKRCSQGWLMPGKETSTTSDHAYVPLPSVFPVPILYIIYSTLSPYLVPVPAKPLLLPICL